MVKCFFLLMDSANTPTLRKVWGATEGALFSAPLRWSDLFEEGAAWQASTPAEK